MQMAYDWTLLTLASPFSSLEIAPPFFIAHLFGESGFLDIMATEGSSGRWIVMA